MSKPEQLANLRDWLSQVHGTSLAEFDQYLRQRYDTNLRDWADENWDFAGLGMISAVVTNGIDEGLPWVNNNEHGQRNQ